jgi:hypothetical protein
MLGAAFFEIYRQGMSTERLVFYVTVAFVFILLFSNLLASWVWVLPMCLLYATIKEKPDLGAYMLVFGTTTAFLEVSNTSGSAYLLLGNVGFSILPAIEAINNRVRLFSVMVACLAIILLFMLRYGSGSASVTMLRTSALAFLLYLLLYFWLGVYLS